MDTKLQIRIDEDIKFKSELVLKTIGLDLSTAIRMFLLKVIRTGGIPFDPVIEEPFDSKEFEKAWAECSKRAKETGASQMTLDEINEIIHETRMNMKAKAQKSEK